MIFDYALISTSQHNILLGHFCLTRCLRLKVREDESADDVDAPGITLALTFIELYPGA